MARAVAAGIEIPQGLHGGIKKPACRTMCGSGQRQAIEQLEGRRIQTPGGIQPTQRRGAAVETEYLLQPLDLGAGGKGDAPRLGMAQRDRGARAKGGALPAVQRYGIAGSGPCERCGRDGKKTATGEGHVSSAFLGTVV